MAKITIKGLDRFTRNLDKYPVEVQDKIDKVLTAGALEIRALSVVDSPIDEGQLRRSITATVNTPLKKRVSVRAEYAPFVEFGTKKGFRVTPGYEQYASQFKGKKLKNSTFADFIDRLEGWAKRHKLGKGKGKNKFRAIAFVIAQKILRNGIKARAFFLPNVDKVFKDVSGQIEKIVKSQKL